MTGGTSYSTAILPETGVQPNCTEKNRIRSSAPPEDRHRIAGQRNAHHRVVDDRVALHCREHAGRQPHHESEDQREGCELDRGREKRCEFPGDTVVRRQRAAEVPVQHLHEVVTVLHRQWPVESEFMQKARTARGVHAALAGNILDRIARNQVNQRERKQRDAEKRRDDQRQATQHEAEHWPRLYIKKSATPSESRFPASRTKRFGYALCDTFLARYTNHPPGRAVRLHGDGAFAATGHGQLQRIAAVLR